MTHVCNDACILINTKNMQKNDKVVAVIEKEAEPIIREAQKLEIKSAKDMQGATEILSRLNTVLDRVTEEKEKVTKPLNEALKAERSRWKPIEELYGGVIDTLRKRMIAYQTEQKRIADAEAAAIASRIKPGKGNLSIEKGVEKLKEIEKPAERVATDAGTVKFKTVRKARFRPLADFAHVEELVKLAKAGYIVWDEAKARRAALDGEKLYGVEVYEEQVPTNFR